MSAPAHAGTVDLLGDGGGGGGGWAGMGRLLPQFEICNVQAFIATRCPFAAMSIDLRKRAFCSGSSLFFRGRDSSVGTALD